MTACKLTKEECITILEDVCRCGVRIGAYMLRECAMLKAAQRYLDPTVPVKEKPTLNLPEDKREMTAFKILVQGAEKAFNYDARNGQLFFSVSDGLLLVEAVEFVSKLQQDEKLEKLETIRKKIAARKILRALHRRFASAAELHEHLWRPDGPMVRKTYSEHGRV